MELENISKNSQRVHFECIRREELLKRAIQEAVVNLEETKKIFKSKMIREVREKLIKVIK